MFNKLIMNLFDVRPKRGGNAIINRVVGAIINRVGGAISNRGLEVSRVPHYRVLTLFQ